MTVTGFEIGNSVAVNPNVSIWYDAASRFSVMGAAGYLFTRPKLTLLASDRALTTTRNLDTSVLKVGIVYQIF